MMNDEMLNQLINELTRTAPDLSRLAGNEDALARLLDAYEARDAHTVRTILEDLQLAQYCTYICSLICVWHCFKVVRLFCQEIPAEPYELSELQGFSQRIASLAGDEESSERLVEAVANQDFDTFNRIIEQFELQRFCFLVTYWVCHLHCRRFCYIICPPLEPVIEGNALDEFRQTATAAGKLGADLDVFEAALNSAQVGDYSALQNIFTELELIPCIFICRWLCFIHCFRICQLICVRFPLRFTVRQFSEFLIGWYQLTADERVVEDLVVAYARQDGEQFNRILEEFNLQPYCFVVCRWICHVHCGLFCTLVCPPALACQLDDPVECVAEEILQQPPSLVVAVRGTAGGADFDHYILEWSTDDVSYQTTYFHYPPVPPGGGTQGNNPVSNGLLAYFETILLDADDYFIRLTVFTESGATRTCKTQFSLFKQDVRILGIRGFTNLDKPTLDPDARFVESFTRKCSLISTTEEVSFGGNISVQGSAFVGGCDEKEIKLYTLSIKDGHETNCASGGWTEFWRIEYNTPEQYRDMNMRTDTDTLTAKWVEDCIIPIPFPPYCLLIEPESRLQPASWSSKIAACERSGLYTLKLDVEDVSSNHYCDLQRIWLDNKPGHARIEIGGVVPCADINLSDLVSVPDCTVPWPLPLVGIAYDEYIDESLPTSLRPNDNFAFYEIDVQKQGSDWLQIPIDAPDGTCDFGTNRVGIPGDRCESPGGSDTVGLLAEFDLRALDPTCKAGTSYSGRIKDSFLLSRGECCVYIFRLRVYDTTKRSGGGLVGHDLWPVKICNDL